MMRNIFFCCERICLASKGSRKIVECEESNNNNKKKSTSDSTSSRRYCCDLLFCSFAAFWCLFGLGNTPSANSRLERFQVRGHVSLQRGHHVRARGGCEFRPAGPPERLFHHHFHFHHILHDGDVVSGLCAKGNIRRL